MAADRARAEPSGSGGVVRGFLAHALDHAGRAGLPLGLGLVLGYYLADQRVRFLPTVLEIVMALFLASLFAIIIGRAWRGEARTGRGARLRRRIIAALALAVIVIAGRLALFWAEQPSALTALSDRELNAALTADAARYVELDQGLERLVRRLEGTSVIPSDPDAVLTADQEHVLVDVWAGIYGLAFSLDQVRGFYEDYFRFDPSVAERDKHVRSFLLTFAAEIALYEKAARVTRVLLPNKNVVKFLDSPHPQRGLPAGTFGFVRDELVGSSDQTRVAVGRRYLQFLDRGLHRRTEVESWGYGWLWKRVEGHLAIIDDVAPLERAAMSLRGDAQPLKRAARRIWYPAVSNVAEWMGDTRVRRVGWYLIPREQQEEMDPRLEPGDILVSRKNWYISNIGLPGFWPHAILYLGDPKKFEAYFDDPSVRAWVKQTCGEDLSFLEFVAKRWPADTRHYLAGHEGEPYRVMEAISEGVVFNSLSHAAGDYLAALRPKLSKVAKAQAIAEAFTHLGKPYDYDFDFATDHALVCTELVWRAYRPREGKPGLTFDLIDVAGRKTLPANQIVRQFAARHGTPNAELDYVYFIDALEKSRRTVVSNEGALLESHARTRWDVRLK